MRHTYIKKLTLDTLTVSTMQKKREIFTQKRNNEPKGRLILYVIYYKIEDIRDRH